MFQYGFGILKFALWTCTNPGYPCKVSENATPRDGNCLIHGMNS